MNNNGFWLSSVFYFFTCIIGVDLPLPLITLLYSLHCFGCRLQWIGWSSMMDSIIICIGFDHGLCWVWSLDSFILCIALTFVWFDLYRWAALDLMMVCIRRNHGLHCIWSWSAVYLIIVCITYVHGLHCRCSWSVLYLIMVCIVFNDHMHWIWSYMFCLHCLIQTLIEALWKWLRFEIWLKQFFVLYGTSFLFTWRERFNLYSWAVHDT